MSREDFANQYFSDVVREKENRSRQEVEDMISRALHCPHCNYVVAYAYKDMTAGHMNIKCPRCKQISFMNLGYFYHSKSMKKPFPGIDLLPPFADKPEPMSYDEYVEKSANSSEELPGYFQYKAMVNETAEIGSYEDYMNQIRMEYKISKILRY